MIFYYLHLIIMKSMIIRIVIEEITEGKDTYFLATSPDIEGFMAEADSYEEIKEITPSLILDMLKSRLEREEEKKAKLNVNLNYSFSSLHNSYSLCY